MIGVVGLLGPVAFGSPNLAIKGSYISVPLILAAVLYLSISRSEKKSGIKTRLPLRSSVSVYLIFWACAVLVAVVFVRSLIYYSLIAACSTLIIWQIFCHEETIALKLGVLFEASILFLNIIYTVTLKYYFYVGGTDPLAHAYLVESLLNTTEITNAFDIYESFPLYHIMVSSLSLAGGSYLPPRKWNVLFVGLVGVLGIFFIFLTVRWILTDWRYAAVATALLAINSIYIYYMIRAIPRSVMTVFTAFIIFSTLHSSRRLQLLIAFPIIVLVMYHTATVPYILSILCLLLLLQLVFSHRDQATNTGRVIFFLGIGAISYWAFYAEELLLAFFSVLISTSVEAPGGGVSFNSDTIVANLWNNLQYVGVISLAILGGIWSLREDELNWEGLTVILAGTILVALTFPGPLQFIEQLESLELRRWSEYTIPLVSIAASFGTIELYDRLDSSQMRVVFFTFLLVTAGLSVSNTLVAPENPIVEEPRHTPYLEKSEVDATVFAAQNSKNGVMADYVSFRYLQWSNYADKPHIMEVSSTNEIQTGPQTGLVIIRQQELRKSGLKVYPLGENSFTYKPTWRGGGVLELYPDVQMDSSAHNQIYDNGINVIYGNDS
ncbi:hypothetical protein ACFQJ7_10020 [Halovenus rubra]|uniref:Uncharacterized protein n=2 Tax=Halovenus rubra TaxID=869890 RepID=A0ACC7DWR0_9EURY|nr:hypothetical protein [Halovenus rubra]